MDKYSEIDIMELDIVAASYRLVGDASAYEDVIDGLVKRFEIGENLDTQSIEAGLLSQHLATVSRMLDQVSNDTDNDAITDTVQSVSGPAAIISPSNLIIALNDSAAQEWDIRRGAKSDLIWIDVNSLDDLKQVRRSASNGGNRMHAILRTIDGNGDISLAEAFVLDKAERPGMVAIRVLDLVWTEALANLLKETFLFTDAEIDISRHFLNKRDLAEIAEIRATSLLTVRKQLWSIFAKTETSSQVELLRLLATLSAHMSRHLVGIESGWKDPLDREEVFTDPASGRKIAFTWAGDENGKPALLSHGLTTGYLWLPSAIEILQHSGVKLYMISRPAFGNSEPAPLADPLQMNADAINALEQHLGIEAWVVIGQGTGALPLFRAARNPASAIRTVIGVGTYLPFAKNDRFERYPRARRIAMLLARSSPILADFTCRVFYRGMRADGPDFIVQALYNKGGADAEYAKSPDCIAFMRTAYSMLCTHQHKAVATDLRMLVSDRAEDYEQCPCPIHFVHGENDPANPVEPIRQFVEKQPTMKLHPLPDAGELLFFSHCDDLAEILTKTVSN